MLKPGGEALFTYIIFSAFYIGQEILAKSKKWRHYFEKVEEFLPCFRHSTDVALEYKTYLKNTGFNCKNCVVEDKFIRFPSYAIFSNFSCVVNRFIAYVPSQKQSEYITEYINEIVKLKSTRIETISSEKVVYIDYRHMVALVSKT